MTIDYKALLAEMQGPDMDRVAAVRAEAESRGSLPDMTWSDWCALYYEVTRIGFPPQPPVWAIAMGQEVRRRRSRLPYGNRKARSASRWLRARGMLR